MALHLGVLRGGVKRENAGSHTRPPMAHQDGENAARQARAQRWKTNTRLSHDRDLNDSDHCGGRRTWTGGDRNAGVGYPAQMTCASRMHTSSPGRLFTLLAFSTVFMSLTATPAHAYSTRLHIAYANELREALILSGDGSIQLIGSDFAVQLPAEDAAAIEAEPLAFRAGAIGPDNFVFPGMTDGTHGVEQDPYRQCQLLYEDALTQEERAYALGCFVHGTGDAIAHHLVNWFTGETFTLTPLSHSHMSNFDNVIGHITTESTIQRAVYESDPSDFTAGQLALSIPRGFVGRNYHNPDSPLYQLMTRHIIRRVDDARAADPEAGLFTIASGLGLGAWEHLALAPYYVDEVENQRANLRTFVLEEIADMQDPTSTRGMELMVGEGPDGLFSTEDDTTACSGSCPSLYARYYTFVRLLLPRRDAGGRELPSAFDKLSDEFGDDLNLLLPALLETIERLSVVLNAPIEDSGGADFELLAADVNFAMEPMRTWLTNATAIDYETVSRAVTPTWYQDLSDFFASAGISISPASLIEVLFGPILEQVRMLVEERVIGEAEMYLDELTQSYRDGHDAWETCIATKLEASTPPGATGHAFDNIRESGFWAYTINLMATTLANHEIVLTPEGRDPLEEGAASFDASFTHIWTQAGICSYLQPEVFPLGLDIDAFLSILDGDTVLQAVVDMDVPVECHAGSLMSFGDPNAVNCQHVTIDELRERFLGSTSRSYPPEAAMRMPPCRNLTVPGLPEPPDPPIGEDGGPGGTDSGGTGEDAGTTTPTDDGGCGCRTSGSSGAALPLLLVLGFGLRRRRGM